MCQTNGAKNPGDNRIDRAPIGIEHRLPHQQERHAGGEGGQIEQRAIGNDARQLLVQKHGQNQRSADRQRNAQHEIESIDEVEPEIGVVHQLAEIFQPDPMDFPRLLKIPICECGKKRNQNRTGGECEKTEEIGEEK